jgi:hypothetical protein
LRWSAATLALVAAWGVLYVHVVDRAGLLMARELFQDPGILATPWPLRYAWALALSLGDAFSLGGLEPRGRMAVVIALAAIGVALILGFAARREARARLYEHRSWMVWGLAWFAGATVLLAEVYPEWRSYRSAFALIGLGMAITPLLAALHPALLGALLVVRLLAFAASPSPRGAIGENPESSAASIDYPEMVRLQRVVSETRRTLVEMHPELPRDARIARHLMPHLSLYAFGGDKALQVWYRDSTVRWMSFGDFLSNLRASPVTLVEFQPPGARRVALVNPEAMRALVAASDSLKRGRWEIGLAMLARAESLQSDRAARAFFGLCAGERARAFGALERYADAEREALHSVRLWPGNADPRMTLAYLWATRGRLEEASAQLDTLLSFTPRDTSARVLQRQIGSVLARRGLAPPRSNK